MIFLHCPLVHIYTLIQRNITRHDQNTKSIPKEKHDSYTSHTLTNTERKTTPIYFLVRLNYDETFTGFRSIIMLSVTINFIGSSLQIFLHRHRQSRFIGSSLQIFLHRHQQ